MSAYGCAVTALAMAMSNAGVAKIQGVLGPQDLDPSVLNEFMSNTADLPSPGGLYTDIGDVDWYNTPGRFVVGGKPLQFDSTVALDDALCSQNLPVIVKVADPFGLPHFVLVNSKQGSATDGSEYAIADPGSSRTATLKDYGNSYSTVGVVKDPPDLSQFNVQVADEADLLVVDANGLRTGFDPAPGVIVKEIPSSGYLRNQIGDDATGETSTGVTHSVQVLRPTPGPYQITLTGLRLGLYTAKVYAYSQNGQVPSPLTITGLTSPGATSSLQLQYSPSTGTPSTVLLMASFQSTIADISNSLQLGLIDNHGIANSLSQKIQAAQAASGPARNNTLNAFKNEVNAQTGKHLTGIAPQVLLQDADSLISQNP